MSLLQVKNLCAGYGLANVLRDISINLAEGEVTALLGRNGAGKSTLIKTLIGALPISTGSFHFDGTDITGTPSFRIARRGIGYVPEERRIFTDLTVRENLEVGRQPPRSGHPSWTAERLFALFPNLAAMQGRSAGMMSGGEQQMLAIARTLMGNPRLLLLDEPSEGLAPVIVTQMQTAIRALRAEGVTMLVAEQNLAFITGIADRALVLETGQLVWQGTMAAFTADPTMRADYLQLPATDRETQRLREEISTPPPSGR